MFNNGKQITVRKKQLPQKARPQLTQRKHSQCSPRHTELLRPIEETKPFMTVFVIPSSKFKIMIHSKSRGKVSFSFFCLSFVSCFITQKANLHIDKLHTNIPGTLCTPSHLILSESSWKLTMKTKQQHNANTNRLSRRISKTTHFLKEKLSLELNLHSQLTETFSYVIEQSLSSQGIVQQASS